MYYNNGKEMIVEDICTLRQMSIFSLAILKEIDEEKGIIFVIPITGTKIIGFSELEKMSKVNSYKAHSVNLILREKDWKDIRNTFLDKEFNIPNDDIPDYLIDLWKNE